MTRFLYSGEQCSRVENSSAGCIPESRVIFPPRDKPLAGAIRSEQFKLTFWLSTIGPGDPRAYAPR
jgi:hypothetical protein